MKPRDSIAHAAAVVLASACLFAAWRIMAGKPTNPHGEKPAPPEPDKHVQWKPKPGDRRVQIGSFRGNPIVCDPALYPGRFHQEDSDATH